MARAASQETSRLANLKKLYSNDNEDELFGVLNGHSDLSNDVAENSVVKEGKEALRQINGEDKMDNKLHIDNSEKCGLDSIVSEDNIKPVFIDENSNSKVPPNVQNVLTYEV